jgi:pyruvate ferredoxin oxidoreductase alpha subunit
MMGSRDAGWIQIFTENTQEVYDTTIQAFKIAEKVLLPVTVNLDGFITSHCVEGVKVLKDTEVKKFLPKREADLKIDPNRPLTFGPLCLTDYHFEFKRQQEEAMKAALKQVKRVGVEFGRLARRKYGVLHPYKLGDAEVALVCLGSTAGTARLVVDRLRAQGKRVGVVRVRLYRPFPAKEFIRVAGHAKLVVVLDRAASPGGPVGPLGADVKATLYHAPARPEVLNVIYGLGGRDVTLSELKKVFDVGLRAARRGVVRRPVIWMGVRE